MNKSPKKKLCWNCEGSVSFAEETCPFCGVSVIPAFLEGTHFAPPYSPYPEENFDVPKSPYEMHENTENSGISIADPLLLKEKKEELTTTEFKQTAIAVTLLFTGSVFFLFGIALALFSHQGIFTLKWDGESWFIYTLLAIPLLLIGWRSLTKLD